MRNRAERNLNAKKDVSTNCSIFALVNVTTHAFRYLVVFSFASSSFGFVLYSYDFHQHLLDTHTVCTHSFIWQYQIDTLSNLYQTQKRVNGKERSKKKAQWRGEQKCLPKIARILFEMKEEEKKNERCLNLA